MARIVVIDPIRVSHQGPVAPGPGGHEQTIHLLQGALDGACGPYCLFMALMICGLVERDTLTLLKPVDGRTSAGRLIAGLEEYGALFRDGTHLEDLVTLLRENFGTRLASEISGVRGSNLRAFIERHILDNHPVILGIDFATSGHWVLVVGLEYETCSGDEKDTGRLSRFLILDPGESHSRVCAWNGILQARGSGGPYPYEWAGKHKIQLDCAVALWPK